MRYQYIYVAGPITNGNSLLNLRDGMLAGIDLIKRGFTPYIPHNDMIQYMLDPVTMDYETILEQDLSWVEKCDALLRLPGSSPGADREVAHAKANNIQTFYNVHVLEEANEIHAAAGE